MASRHLRLGLLGLFFLLGLLLLGTGLTGYVTSDTTSSVGETAFFGLAIIALVGLLVAGEVAYAKRVREREELLRLV